MKVTIFGAGYVGLVQAAAFAEVGHDVVGVDVDAARIDGLKRGIVPIFEPDLEGMIRRGLAAGKLAFTTDAAVGVAHAGILFIAVGTPPRPDGSADVSHVVAVTNTIAAAMAEPKILVTKSTVPVGTGDRVRATLTAALAARGRSDLTAEIVSNPEFLKEGSAVADCMRPDRIILGTSSPTAEQALRELYAPFIRGPANVIVMDARSAELTKYAANAMLATRISFMNEMANIAERVGADIEQVRVGIGSDPRIGGSFLQPGAGYGGSCFPKDVRALIHTATEAGIDPLMLAAVEGRNAAQKHVLVDKAVAHFGGIRGRRFALWGLSFKPNTSDMREAPSRAILEGLWAAGATVTAYDPAAMDECRRLYGERPGLAYAASADAALDGADALIIATEWSAFKSVSLETIRATLKQSVVFDGRNIIDPAAATRAGLTYFGIGRGGAV